MNICQILKELGACQEAIDWVQQQPDQHSLQQLYESMDSALWCGWLCERLGVGQNFIDAWEIDMRGKPVFRQFLRDEHDLLGEKLFAGQRAKVRSWRDSIEVTVSQVTHTQENLLITAIYKRKLNKFIDDYNKDIDKLFRVDNFVEKHRPSWSVVEQALQTIIKEE